MRFKIFAITAATLLLSQPAAAKTAKHNIVVQSYREIQNSNMYEPGFNQGVMRRVSTKAERVGYCRSRTGRKAG